MPSSDSQPEKKLNRRELLRAAGRNAVLVGAAVIAGRLLSSRDQKPLHDPCATPGQCRDCAILGDCPQPQAITLRTQGGRR